MKTRIDLASLAKQAGIRRSKVRIRPIEPRRATEQAYARALRQMLREAAKVVREQVLPAALATKRDMARDDTDRLDGVLGLLRSAVEYQLLRATEDMVERILGLQAQRHTRRFSESVRSALGIDLSAVIGQGDIADEFALAARRNVGLIKDLSEEVTKRVEQVVVNSVIRGQPHAELAKQLTHEFGILESRARLIARDQVSKLTSDLNRLRQTQVGIAEYSWSTSGDERVRPSHAAMEGMICRWDDPTVYREDGEEGWRSRSSLGGVQLHPGEDIQCRCVPIAVINL